MIAATNQYIALIKKKKDIFTCLIGIFLQIKDSFMDSLVVIGRHKHTKNEPFHTLIRQKVA